MGGKRGGGRGGSGKKHNVKEEGRGRIIGERKRKNVRRYGGKRNRVTERKGKRRKKRRRQAKGGKGGKGGTKKEK